MEHPKTQPLPACRCAALSVPRAGDQCLSLRRNNSKLWKDAGKPCQEFSSQFLIRHVGKRALKLGLARRPHDVRHHAKIGRRIVSPHPLDHLLAVLFPVGVQILQKGLAQLISSAAWAAADASMTEYKLAAANRITSISVARGV